MTETRAQVLSLDLTVGKLWNSECQQPMEPEHDEMTQRIYRCDPVCGKHTAGADRVNDGLLWHYRGRRAGQTFGLPDEHIIDEMMSALRVAWVRHGRIYTAQFD